MTPRATTILVSVLTLFGLGAIGYWMLFSYFPGYDDEGYIMFSVREYAAHGRLYDLVYSQYGPTFYVFADALQRLMGSPINHVSARLLTLGLWLGTAAACAGFVWQQTRVRALAFFTVVGAFLHLYYTPGEPFHPSALILFVIALSLWVKAALIDADRWPAVALVAGVTGAILLLTKINIGIFYIVGVGAWGLLHSKLHRGRRGLAAVIGGMLVFVAAALMNTLWREAWIQVYLAIFAAGAFGLVLAVRSETVVKPGHAGLFALAVGIGGLTIIAPVWLRGTSAHGFIEGLLLGPMRHPANYAYPVDWRPGGLLIAGLSLAAALAWPWIRRRYPAAAVDAVVVVLRLVQTAALLTGLALLINFRVVGAVFTYTAPLIWVWVIPLEGTEQRRPVRLTRGLLAFVLLLQYLQAYPIGGGQESWGTMLFIPLVALGLDDIRLWWHARKPDAAPSAQWWLAITVAMVAVVTVKAVTVGRTAYASYASSAELGLPGASNLHLPEATRTAYRIVCLNAVAHGDMLFSLPGMYSFNLWTDLPAPTEKNVTVWFTLLTDDEQREIIRSIEQSRRPCIVMQESLIAMLRETGISIQGPLRDYLMQNFSPAFNIEGFVFLVRTGRSIAPLNVAELRRRADLPRGAPADQLDFRLAGDGTPIAAIEASDFASPQSDELILNAANSRVTAVAIDSADHVTGAPTDMSWPLQTKGLVHLYIRFDRAGRELPPLTTAFYLKAADGRILGEVRIPE